MKRLTIVALALAVVFLPIACGRATPAGKTGTPLAETGEQARTVERSATPTSASAPVAPASTSAPAAEATLDPTAQAYVSGFAGTWDTNWGTMVLTVTGSTVTGVYEYQEGRIEATLSGDGSTMEGTWAEAPEYAPPDDGGRMVFTLAEDGESLTGYWWYGQDEDGGEWTGTRMGSSGAPEPSPDETEATPQAGGTGEVGFTLSSNPDNDLLFYVTREGGGRVYYFGTEEGGAMRLSHVVLDDGAGNQDIVIYDSRLLPVQWILPEVTIAVYPAPEGDEPLGEGEPWFDPHQAFHVVVRGQEEQTVTADIVPGDLGAVLDELEAATGQRFEGARAFLAAHDVTFDELVALAGEGGPEQPLYIAAAAGFSAAAAALGLERVGGQLAAVPRLPGLGAPRAVIFGEVIKVGAGAAGGVLADMLGAGLDPGNGPSVGVLLCRGAAKYGVCHYVFFHRNRLGDCITLCQTSLGCFTDICMPMDISAEMAMGMRSGF